MKAASLEVTYRKGRFVAAYLYLPGSPDEPSVRTQKTRSGLLVDFARDGRAIGVEILTPRKRFALAEINAILGAAGQRPLTKRDVAPIPGE